MAVLSSLFSPAVWHVLAWGTLLGTEFHQSFVGGVVAYRALSRPQFSQLQQKIFPVYFALQTALPAVCLLTYPGAPLSSLLSSAHPDFGPVAVPTLVTFFTSLGNMLVVGPWTTKIMRERKAQETAEGKKYYDEGPKSQKMAELNKRFGMAHGLSSLMNMVGFFGTVYYGATLAGKLVF